MFNDNVFLASDAANARTLIIIAIGGGGVRLHFTDWF